MASNRGFYALHPKEKQLERYWKEGKNEYHLPLQTVHHFHIDQEGIFWLATARNGLIRWNPKSITSNDRIQQFTIENGSSSNTLYAIYEDNYERLWISSHQGIMQFDKQTQQIQKYSLRDGIIIKAE